MQVAIKTGFDYIVYLLNILSSLALENRGYQVNSFLISPQKQMFLVLISLWRNKDI